MSIKGAEGERIYLLLRAIVGFLATSSAYISYRLVPLADATAIIFAAPIFVSIFAKILLKESCGRFQMFNIGIAMLGVVLIAKPTFIFGDIHNEIIDTKTQIEGTCAAFFSSLCFALTFVLMRKLEKTPAEVIIFWFAVSSIGLGVISLSVLTVSHDFVPAMPSTTREVALLFLSGLFGIISQPLLTVALKIEEAGAVSLARTIDVALAFFYQIVFLGEPVHWTSLLGALIVIVGVVIAILRKWHEERPETFKQVFCGGKEAEEERESARLRQETIVSYSGLKEEFP